MVSLNINKKRANENVSANPKKSFVSSISAGLPLLVYCSRILCDYLIPRTCSFWKRNEE